MSENYMQQKPRVVTQPLIIVYRTDTGIACEIWPPADDPSYGFEGYGLIIASDGVEARPVCPTCKGAGALFGPYDPSDRTPCPECTPAAAP